MESAENMDPLDEVEACSDDVAMLSLLQVLFLFVAEIFPDPGDDEPRTCKPNIDRDHKGCFIRLIRLFFCASPVYDEHRFRTKWRMRRDLFIGIYNAVIQHDP